ncbi:amidohydrolase family protein [Massilia sp. W12]|uniref:amidohydrolase family protein n=1 Tax=Massilia sp. W12 TaxID=3126507 RepID=UPI0030D0BB36
MFAHHPRQLALRPLAFAAALLLAAPALAKEEKNAWDVNHPPGAKQSVQLDVRSGTWMSVDVSPDGKEVLFDLLGDLYVLPLEGGAARALTRGMAWDMQARFAPDGKHILYMSDAGGGDNLWLMQRDGSGARPLTKEDYRLLNNPVWHPQGEYVAARKHMVGSRSAGSGEIWLYHKDGGQGVQLTDKPNWQKDSGEPAFSPDGRYLYYSQDVTPGSTFEYNKNSHRQIYQILRRDLQEGKTIPFVRGPGGAVRPTPSPDGRYLAFVRRVLGQSTLFLKDLQSGAEIPVWNQLERDLQESWAMHGVYPSFAWLPGSRELVIWARGKLWRVAPFDASGAPQQAAAKEIPFHIKDTREIRPALRFAQQAAPEQFAVRELRWPRVAPQGDQVAYAALGKIWLRKLPDGKPQRMSSQEQHMEMFPVFSPDGKQLAYTTWHDSEFGSVRVRDLASGKEVVLSKEPGKYLSPAFSSDGRQLAWVKSSAAYLTSPWHGLNPGVYAAAVHGAEAPHLLTEHGSAPQSAGAHWYVTRNRALDEVSFETTLVRLAQGGNPESIVAKSDAASEIVFSPNGRELAFIDHRHAYIMPAPLTGKTLDVSRQAGLPQQKLDVNAANGVHFSGDGQRLYFTLGAELHSRDLQSLRQQRSEQARKAGLAAVKKDNKATDKAAAQGWQPPEQGLPIGFMHASDKPRGLLVLDGAKIITMQGDQVITRGRIVLQDNRILALGEQDKVALPAKAQVVDVSGKTIIPGLVDVHWHGAMADDEITPQQSWINHASLAFGVTTLHDPSNDTEAIFTQAELQRAGLITAPRIFSTGTILYGPRIPFGSPVESLEDALTHVKRMKAHGAFSVKSYNQPRRDQRQQIVEAARQQNMMVVPEGGALFQHNMTMIIDGHTGIEHALPLENVYEDVLQLWGQSKVGYTPTLGVGYGGLDGEHYWYAHSEVWKHPLLTRHVPAGILQARAVRRELAPEQDYNVFKIARGAQQLSAHGVKVNLGAHGQREGLAAHWEMWTLVKGGMTPHQALRSATLNGAHYLGLDKDLGSLEVGKLADLVVLDADPLKNIRDSDKVHMVMLNGRLYDAAGMHQIAPQQVKRAPYYFERNAGAGMQLDVGGEIGHGHGHGH